MHNAPLAIHPSPLPLPSSQDAMEKARDWSLRHTSWGTSVATPTVVWGGTVAGEAPFMSTSDRVPVRMGSLIPQGSGGPGEGFGPIS